MQQRPREGKGKTQDTLCVGVESATAKRKEREAGGERRGYGKRRPQYRVKSAAAVIVIRSKGEHAGGGGGASVNTHRKTTKKERGSLPLWPSLVLFSNGRAAAEAERKKAPLRCARRRRRCTYAVYSAQRAKGAGAKKAKAVFHSAFLFSSSLLSVSPSLSPSPSPSPFSLPLSLSLYRVRPRDHKSV